MRKSELTGTGQVFTFTLTQHYKSKATIITLAILLLFALASVPLMSLLSGQNADSASGIDSAVVSGTGQPTADAEDFAFLKTVYIQNDTDLPISAAALAALDPTLGEVSWTDAADLSAVAEDASCAGIQITGAAGQYDVTVSAAPDTLLSENVLATLGSVLSNTVYSAALDAAGVTGTQLEAVSADWSVSTKTQTEWTQEEDNYGFDVLYGVNYGYSLIMMFLCMMSTSYILSALVEEKASRLVEVLLVSVQPLALIAGKILAVMAWMTMEVLLLAGGFGLSCLLAPLLPGISSLNILADNAGFGTFLSSLDWTLIPVLLFSLILGYATFSLLGGLFGSGCSSTEDTTGASLGVTMLVLIGYFAAMFQGIFDNRTLSVILSLVPFLSVFCAPANYLLDVIGPGILIASWVIQLATIWGLARLTATVYRSLIFYHGNRLKIGKLFAVAKKAKGGAIQ